MILSYGPTLRQNFQWLRHTMGLMMSKGHSRIPICSGYATNIVGLILVKTLIFCRPEDEMPIKYMAIRSIPRVYDNWPLYDVLNLFQKAHGHMAVVIKSNEDAKTPANSSISNPSMLTINTHTSSCSMPADHRDYFSARTANVIKQGENLASQYKRREQGDGNVLHENVESHPGNSDEEVIGIITMKDVMEELLQEDIWDENDGYIDVHNRIRINLLPLRRSSSSSNSNNILYATPEVHLPHPESFRARELHIDTAPGHKSSFSY